MNIVWSKNALQDADKAFLYATENFGRFQTLKLAERIHLGEKRIKAFPESCPLEQTLINGSRTFRYFSLFKNLEMIFHKESDEVCIIDAIWDTRQNPSKLKDRI